ncbi:hypothetical protein O3P69_016972 [Scylla paramamosain]|uniref:Ig-like domain-containing protein n=1 Tax=Scylla paramamosain TaxID=85552 RepID=A0AAW0TTY5_SCYPA
MMTLVKRVVVVAAAVLVVRVAVRAERQLATPDQELPPVFLEPVPNVTVAVGRDASLTCSVDNLGQHKVGDAECCAVLLW